MDTMTATMICEGLEEADEETVIQAWQQLIDTGLAWQLQGSFGRQAQALIDQGVCTKSAKPSNPGNVGPYVKVCRDEILTFKVDGQARKFRVLLYGGYNAMGLIGHEYNGVAVLDEDQLRVLCDNIECIDSGYYGPSARQVKAYDGVLAMAWPEFRAMINASPRARYTI